jgi:hypothetical protein
MKSWAATFAALAIIATCTNCKKSVTKPFSEFEDRACACQNVACGDSVLSQFEEFVRKSSRATAITNDESKQIIASAVRMGKCLVASGVSEPKLTSAFQSLRYAGRSGE